MQTDIAQWMSNLKTFDGGAPNLACRLRNVLCCLVVTCCYRKNFEIRAELTFAFVQDIPVALEFKSFATFQLSCYSIRLILTVRVDGFAESSVCWNLAHFIHRCTDFTRKRKLSKLENEKKEKFSNFVSKLNTAKHVQTASPEINSGELSFCLNRIWAGDQDFHPHTQS